MSEIECYPFSSSSACSVTFLLSKRKEKTAICINPSFHSDQICKALDQMKLRLVGIFFTQPILFCMAHAQLLSQKSGANVFGQAKDLIALRDLHQKSLAEGYCGIHPPQICIVEAGLYPYGVEYMEDGGLVLQGKWWLDDVSHEAMLQAQSLGLKIIDVSKPG
ncbi:MAG: hypothetical protein KDD52_05855 [Bdellovibrionales bacterium]|nr:hypothetical protein [Bdellovibrionales bacterium]